MNNYFAYSFSKQGAIFTHDVILGAKNSLMVFKGNRYEVAYSLDSPVMRAKTQGSSNTETRAVYIFEDEYVDRV